jgi:hypothetical protein
MIDTKNTIELLAVGVMVLGTAGVVANRVVTKKGIGYRVLQWLGIVILPPVILILALEKILSGEIVGALIASLVGFVANEIVRGRQ